MAEVSFTGVTLARILRPWGRRGEVAAEILSDFPQRFSKLRKVWLVNDRNPPRPIAVRNCRIHLGQAVFHFEGIESIDDAEHLRGLEVQVPLSQRAPLARHRHYVTDLIGCQVWEIGTDEPLGVVRDVQGSGAVSLGRVSGIPRDAGSAPQSWLLAVETARGEVLIPMAEEICTLIDIAARRIEVRLPEGLLELNERPHPVANKHDKPKLSHLV